MAKNEKSEVDSTGKDLKALRNELWVVIPFFLAALGFFLGSLSFKRGAGEVPMVVGFATLLMAGMRLFHIIRPQSKIGEFNEAGLAGEFDHRKEEIEEETSKGHYEDPKGKVGTFKSMTFHEAQRTVPPKHTIYRFKGQFERGQAEVRVVLDHEGKLTGHFIKPWREHLN